MSLSGSWVSTCCAVVVCTTLCFLPVLSESESSAEDSLSNGLGDHIKWQKLEEGFVSAKEEGKPLMLIIHKSWCGACKNLKPKFRESKDIAASSSSFIMVNALDEEEPNGDKYQPDGGYIPRILFFDPDGNLLEDVVNENGNPQYKYYYYDDLGIVSSMEKVVSLFSNVKISKNTNSTSNESVNITQTKFEL